MNRDYEALSAFLDGETSELETRRVLRDLDQADIATLGRWQLASDTLRGHASREVPPAFNARLSAALAAEVEADGVHLGQSDGAVGRARMLLGDDKLIGVSCHGRLDLAQKAADEGADYLALGRFFESRTKPGAPPASLDTLREARRRFTLPLVAIGGVNPHNARQLIEAGADLVAVIHALFGHADDADVEAAARRLHAAFPAPPFKESQ